MVLRECQLQTDIQHGKLKWRGTKVGKEKCNLKNDWRTKKCLNIWQWEKRQLILTWEPGSALPSYAAHRMWIFHWFEPLRDQVDQPDVRQYISVHFIHSCYYKQNSNRLDAPILIRLSLNVWLLHWLRPNWNLWPWTKC